jgi:ecdysteroid kinase
MARPDRAGSGWNAGRHEVAFYASVASATVERLVPRCFDANADADNKTWHLLLEDLTDTHETATAWPLPPTIEQCEAIVRARARFHAAWWDDPRLGATVGQWETAETTDQYLGRLSTALQRFTGELGDRLPRERHELYEQLLARAPSLFARYDSHRDLTIVQGDAHVWNCFLPRNGDRDDVRLFDWDSWRIDVGTDDLANMIAMHWYPDRRRRWEQPLLDLYHATLAEHGVGGYDRRALKDDYRLSVLWQMTTPVWQAAYDIPPVIWWNNLERIMLAVDDLGCRDFL